MIGSHPLEEYSTKKACESARVMYSKGAFRDEVFVCSKELKSSKLKLHE